MDWDKIKDSLWFIFIWVCAITLIEYQGDWLLDFAGDVFGALGLFMLGIERALREEIM